jgi:uncharacterized membrane protein YbhN (UPF0104 family)/tRNA A-37 threonylcarbamoyl transferase component Bud32
VVRRNDSRRATGDDEPEGGPPPRLAAVAATEGPRPHAHSATSPTSPTRQTDKARRVRRPVDLLRAVVGAIALAALFGAIHGLPAGSLEISDDVVRATAHIPHWLTVGGSVLAHIGCLVLSLLLLTTLVRQQLRGALNALVAAAAAALAALVTSLVWASEHGDLSRVVLRGANPTVLVFDCAFVAMLTASDIVRRRHWTRWCLRTGGALFLFDVASRALSPFGIPVALVGGLLFGWLTRWLLTTEAARPSSAELAAQLSGPGLPVTYLEDVPHTRGSKLRGSLEDGRQIEVRLANRDTKGLGMARRVWAVLRLRPALAGNAALSQRSRLERLSLTSYLAERTGALVPHVLAMRELEDQALALVTDVPDGHRPTSEVEAKEMAALFAALRRLHEAGVAHRDLRPPNLVLAGGEGGFVSLDAAQPGAGDLLRRLDVVQLLTTLAMLRSPTTALQALRTGYEPPDDAAVAAVLQPIALAPWGWSAMRAASPCVNKMRKELVAPGVELPETPLERFRWRTVASTAGIIAAAFILVGQLSRVNLAGALSHAELVWCLVAVVASAAGNVASAVNLAAFVPQRLPLLRGSAVQLATAFVGVAMPPTVGHVAVNSRYLHKQGVDGSAIAAAVALSQVVNVATTVLLLIVIGVLTGSGVSHQHLAPSGTVLLIIASLVALLGLSLLLPQMRHLLANELWPRMRDMWPRVLEALSKPLRLAIGTGANLALTTCNAVAFLAALRAVGGHPAILPAVAVLLAGNTIGSAAPTPGGVGAIEAALAAGLGALGVPVHEAIPAVLIFRLATFWLPIPAGWASYTWLLRHNAL